MSLSLCPNCGLDLTTAEPAAIGDLTINLAGDTYWRGERVKLTDTEARIVLTLARQPGTFVKPEALINMLGSAAFDEGNVIGVYVCRIRRAFRAVDPRFDRIENRSRRGYRWQVA